MRPQFSLKTLLWLIVVAAAFCTGTQLDRYLKDRADPTQTAIRKALNGKTELDFAEQPLSDVIDFLKQRHDVEIQFDHKALADAGIGTDVPITRSIKGIPLKSALPMMLDELDMAYAVQNGVITITTKANAPSMLNLTTAMWFLVAMAALVGALLLGREWGSRLQRLNNS